MSNSNERQNPGVDRESKSEPNWEAYSDYKYVSYQITSSIQNAIDAYANLQSLHDENAKIRSTQAANARQPILAAAMNLLPELEHNENGKEIYQQILSDWQEDGVDDKGYIEALQSANLSAECPNWLYDFVSQIRKAGWELGYLQAGRYEESDENEGADARAREMIEDILQAK